MMYTWYGERMSMYIDMYIILYNIPGFQKPGISYNIFQKPGILYKLFWSNYITYQVICVRSKLQLF